ncbi:MAG: GNAT family N-acetyltransferase [Deltaproteobacteria bacterium]|nr:GNAT family N-acetyltransferase [Deltaproteobacteria bacterium]
MANLPASAVSAQTYRPDRDRDQVEQLWLRVFGRAKGGQTPAWLFRPAPMIEAPRVVIREFDQVIAHAGAMPVRLMAGEQPLLAGWSVGAMTDPHFRGQGLFVRAGQALYQQMTEQGFDLVGGFSNAQSASLHTGPLQRTPVRPFPWCARPLLPRRAGLRPLAATWPRQVGVEISTVAPGDPRLDAIWRNRPRGPGIATVRDAAWSGWRYQDRPDADYRLALASVGGVPAAWIAVRALTVARVPALFVLDLQCTAQGAQAAAQLLRSAEQLASAAGCVLSSALLPGWGPLRRILRWKGYLPVPERLHPQKILLSVRALGPRVPQVDLADPRSWWLAWSDTDVV